MTGKQADDSKAARMLADFIDRHLARGTGNKGIPQTAAAFAIKSGISASRLSEWRHRKAGLPSIGSLLTLEGTFFPYREARANDPAYREWQEVHRAIVGHGLPTEPGPDDKSFTLRETWNLLTRPVNRNTLALVRFDADAANPQPIEARLTDASFVLPLPSWFEREIAGDPYLAGRYDVHAPTDFSGSTDCAGFYDTVPVRNLRDIVAYHADAYAHFVLDSLSRRSAYPPFNKPKLGLFGYQQSQRAGQHEGVYLDLDLYRTDYFTHRVMRRVLHDVRATHPDLFHDDAVPYEAMPHLRYFTTSLGINVIATTEEGDGKRFYLVRLSDRQGNTNQHDRWHVSVNEGVSLEDVQEGVVDVGAVVKRALSEELGHPYDDGADQTLYLEFAIDRLNWEPFVSCIAHLGVDRETLYRRKQHLARDDRREFREVRDFPFTDEAIMGLVRDSPTGIAGFTTFGLSILDSILVRRSLSPSEHRTRP